MSRNGALALVFALTACQGKVVADPAPAKSETSPTEKAEAPPAEAEPTKADSPTPGDTKAAKLGSQLRDPRWFHPGIWPGATVTKTGRSEVDANGLFSSQILFDLPEGTTVQACVDGMIEKIKPDVTNVAPDPKGPGPDGRLIARGETEHMKVTVVCGLAEGAMKAYLGYQWIKLPEPGAP